MHNLIGQKIGKWFIWYEANRRGKNNELRYWICRCECGKVKEVRQTSLLNSHSKSCGCVPLKKFIKQSTVHGLHDVPEYEIWKAVKARCNNKNGINYKRYGGRGIVVCKRWSKSFENFYKDMGSRPSLDYSIDRINNDGNYEPGNCKWSTRIEQANNTRTNRFLTYGNETKTLAQWSRKFGIDQDKLRHYLNNTGNNMELAIAACRLS